MLHIRVTKGADKGEQIKTRQGVVSVGRSPRCDLALGDNQVSHVHGEFLVVGARCYYRDLLSRNGSFVRCGGETFWLGPLQSEREVKTDDEIVLGNTTILIEAVAPESARPAQRGEDDFAATRAVELNHGRPDDQFPAMAEIARFQGFLALPSHDATSLKETKAAACDALLKAFPDAARVTLIDLLPGDGKELTADRLDASGAVSAGRQSDKGGDDPLYSLQVLSQCYSSRGLVFHGSGAAMPDAASVRLGAMDSCLCLPLWVGGEMSGFLHAYTIAGRGRPFTRRDAQLFSLLGGVVSLLLVRAADAEQRSRWRAAAAAGEAVSGLSHDARPVLDALGKNILGVEKAFPAVARDVSWQLVQQDLKFLRRITRDAIRRARTGLGDLHIREVRVRRMAEEVLDMCRRYFLDSAHRDHVTFVNSCGDSHVATVDRQAVQQAMVNCIKNSLCPLRDAWSRREKRTGTIKIVSAAGVESGRRYCTLSVCDDSGGIPQDVLEQLGHPFVTGRDRRGLGLGMHIVFDAIGRMGGQVKIATSTRSADGLPAGTVVSFNLPLDDTDRKQGIDSSRSRPLVIRDYSHYRKQIENTPSTGD